MSTVDFTKLTTATLRKLAQDRGITVPPGTKKADLVKLLSAAAPDATSPAVSPTAPAPTDLGTATDTRTDAEKAACLYRITHAKHGKAICDARLVADFTDAGWTAHLITE